MNRFILKLSLSYVVLGYCDGAVFANNPSLSALARYIASHDFPLSENQALKAVLPRPKPTLTYPFDFHLQSRLP